MSEPAESFDLITVAVSESISIRCIPATTRRPTHASPRP